MLNPGLPKELWDRLDGQLWHATGPIELLGIISNREIRVGVGERYRSSFCRRHGAVSLFDFGPTAEVVPSRIEQMFGWFGDQQQSRLAIWLEINRARALSNLWNAATARKKWNEPPYGEFIHGVEACHTGVVPLDAIGAVVLVDRDNRERFEDIGGLDDDVSRRISLFERN